MKKIQTILSYGSVELQNENDTYFIVFNPSKNLPHINNTSILIKRETLSDVVDSLLSIISDTSKKLEDYPMEFFDPWHDED